MRKIFTAAVCTLLFAGPLAAADAPRVVEGAAAEIWSGEQDEGDIRHLLTGVVLPDRIGQFDRFRVAAVSDGDDVMANYRAQLDGSPVTVTLFLFKPASLPEHHLRGSLAALAQGQFMQTVWSDGPFDLAVAHPLRLFKGSYKTGLGPDSSMDYLYFAPLGQWTVKVRATLSSPKDPSQERAIDDFVSALPWPQILDANGECSGEACRAERAMAFDHQVPEMFLNLVVKRGEGRTVDRAEPAMHKRIGNIDWDLYPLDERLRPMFEDVFGRITLRGPAYTLSQRRGRDATLVRFFDGLPSEAQFNAEIDTLTRHPEPGNGMVSSADAVAYLGE